MWGLDPGNGAAYLIGHHAEIADFVQAWGEAGRRGEGAGDDLAEGLHDSVTTLCRKHGADTVVLSGGVFQNELLLQDVKTLLESEHLQIWTSHVVPSNDGGISLGQAALAAFANSEPGALLKETDSAWMIHVT